VFVRRDGGQAPIEIPARPGSVTSTSHATSLGHDGAGISTVEHLLAALYALGIDNVRIEADGPEIPVMDGSAASFVQLVRSAGVFRQIEPRSVLRIRKPIELVDGERRIRIEPHRCFRISYAVDFVHPAIGRQELEIPRMDSQVFEQELARARTFGFLEEVNALWKRGLARGGSLENTVVLDSHRILNQGGLRWPDEFVRHKVLDLLGDLALIGMPILGHVSVERGGHGLHQALVRKIVEHPEAWLVTGGDEASPTQNIDSLPVSASAG